MTSEYNKSINVLSISQGATSQQNLINRKGSNSIFHKTCTLKAIQHLIRVFTLNHSTLHISKDIRICVKADFKKLFLALFVLEVSFTIQIFRLNVAQAFWRATIKQNEVSREVLISVNFNYRAHGDLLPFFFSKFSMAAKISQEFKGGKREKELGGVFPNRQLTFFNRFLPNSFAPFLFYLLAL